MPRDEYGLSPKQKTWCDEYLKSGNAVDAARKAGYQKPKQSSIDNRDNLNCQAYIAERMRPTEDKRIADADEVLLFLSRTMRGEIKDQFGLEASLQDRIKASQELMKRYAVADMRQQSTMARLDGIFLEFRAALEAPPPATVPAQLQPATEALQAPTAPTEAPPQATAPPAAPATGPTAAPQPAPEATASTTTTAPGPAP